MGMAAAMTELLAAAVRGSGAVMDHAR